MYKKFLNDSMKLFMEHIKPLSIDDKFVLFGSDFDIIIVVDNTLTIGNKKFTISTFSEYNLALKSLGDYARDYGIIHYKINDVIKILTMYDAVKKHKGIVAFSTLPNGKDVTYIEILGHKFTRFVLDIDYYEYATPNQILDFVYSHNPGSGKAVLGEKVNIQLNLD